MAHVVSVVELSDHLYVFDPMYQQFYFHGDNRTLATYDDIVSQQEPVRRWGVMFHQGTSFRYELSWMYANATKDNISMPSAVIRESFPWAMGLYAMILSFFSVIAVLGVVRAHLQKSHRTRAYISAILAGGTTAAVIYLDPGAFIKWAVYLFPSILAFLLVLYLTYALTTRKKMA